MNFIVTDQITQIFEGKVCPYCKGASELLEDSSEVYGTNYGPIWICKKCSAYVGCHKGTTVALGRLANLQLRACKQGAHRFFDLIWTSQLMSRAEAYEWLSGILDLPPEYTHIGMFGIETCKKVMKEAKLFLNKEHDADVAKGFKPHTEKFILKPDELL